MSQHDNSYSRRQILGGLAAGGLLLGAPALVRAQQASAHVVVVGGGFGGATAARYLRRYQPDVKITLVEPARRFYTCPFSNLYLAGLKEWESLGHGFDGLRKLGIEVIHASAEQVDATAKTVKLSNGATLRWDKLVLSPGVDMQWNKLQGYDEAAAELAPHAWKAGPQTQLLKRQLAAMKDGGTFVMTIPENPFRCPPGPYERACQVAHYFSKAKPKSKVLILDANDDVTSKGPLFKKAWADRYKGIIDYRPKHNLTDVDAATGTLKFEFNDDLKAQVLNVVPPQRAGDIAHNAGLTTANKRWCEVDWQTMESKAAKNIHILGDALQVAPLMPKSGHMANQHGKVAAAAIVALLSGRAPNALPIYNNTCYSFVSDTDVVHVASVHRYDEAQKTMLTVQGSGGVSAAASELEGKYAMAWARNIWADSLA